MVTWQIWKVQYEWRSGKAVKKTKSVHLRRTFKWMNSTTAYHSVDTFYPLWDTGWHISACSLLLSILSLSTEEIRHKAKRRGRLLCLQWPRQSRDNLHWNQNCCLDHLSVTLSVCVPFPRLCLELKITAATSHQTQPSTTDRPDSSSTWAGAFKFLEVSNWISVYQCLRHKQL